MMNEAFTWARIALRIKLLNLLWLPFFQQLTHITMERTVTKSTGNGKCSHSQTAKDFPSASNRSNDVWTAQLLASKIFPHTLANTEKISYMFFCKCWHLQGPSYLWVMILQIFKIIGSFELQLLWQKSLWVFFHLLALCLGNFAWDFQNPHGHSINHGLLLSDNRMTSPTSLLLPSVFNVFQNAPVVRASVTTPKPGCSITTYMYIPELSWIDRYLLTQCCIKNFTCQHEHKDQA